jgi:hypothetical protein
MVSHVQWRQLLQVIKKLNNKIYYLKNGLQSWNLGCRRWEMLLVPHLSIKGMYGVGVC